MTNMAIVWVKCLFYKLFVLYYGKSSQIILIQFLPAMALVLLAWSGCNITYTMFLVCIGKYWAQ